MFYKNMLRFIKNPVKSCIILCLWIGMLWWFLSDDFYSNGLQGAIDLTLPTLPYAFLVFIAISYETFYDIKRYKLEEAICVGKSCRLCVQMHDFWVLMCFNLITSGIVYIFQCFFYQNRGIKNSSLTIYTLRIVFIYVFLVITFAICIGWAVSFIQNRLYGLTTILFVFYIFDYSFVGLIIDLSKSNYSLWKFGTLFCLFFQSGCGVVRDCNYLLTAENVHIYRALFFISLSLFCVVLCGAKKKIISLLPGVFCLAMLFMFFMPSGEVYNFPYMENSFDSVRGDMNYYVEEKQIAKDNEKCNNNRNDFQVKKYDINMRVTDVLHAKVTMEPSCKSLSEYQFTLYRSYKVKRVCNEKGIPLWYEQDGDYLTIKNQEKNLQTITITYSGASQYFYATSQGMLLPANFEYIPIAGWHKVFLMNDDGILEQTFSRELLFQKASIFVKLYLKGKYPVYSNLKVEKGERKEGFTQWIIEGESDGLTLIGSPYLATKEICGVNVVYSELDQYDGPISGKTGDYEVFFETLIKAGYSTEGMTFIVSPMDNNNNWCIGSDHMVSTTTRLQETLTYFDDGTLYYAITDEAIEQGELILEELEDSSEERE